MRCYALAAAPLFFFTFAAMGADEYQILPKGGDLARTSEASVYQTYVFNKTQGRVLNCQAALHITNKIYNKMNCVVQLFSNFPPAGVTLISPGGKASNEILSGFWGIKEDTLYFCWARGRFCLSTDLTHPDPGPPPP
jgi:hypothetical protein